MIEVSDTRLNVSAKPTVPPTQLLLPFLRRIQ
jgi:hypothetical protein